MQFGGAGWLPPEDNLDGLTQYNLDRLVRYDVEELTLGWLYTISRNWPEACWTQSQGTSWRLVGHNLNGRAGSWLYTILMDRPAAVWR